MALTSHTATAETRTGSHKLPIGMTGPPSEEFGGDCTSAAAMSPHCHRGGARSRFYQETPPVLQRPRCGATPEIGPAAISPPSARAGVDGGGVGPTEPDRQPRMLF